MKRALLLALAACSAKPPAELVTGDQVEIREVVKGDEVVVDKKGGAARIRILGIQAFEAVIDDAALKGLAQGGAERLKALALGKKVGLTLAERPKDAHGRFLAFLDLGGLDVGKQMLTDGLAIVYTEYPFAREAEYLAAEATARSRRVQAWGDITSIKMIRGLRREWAEARSGRTKQASTDPLLLEAP